MALILRRKLQAPSKAEVKIESELDKLLRYEAQAHPERRNRTITQAVMDREAAQALERVRMRRGNNAAAPANPYVGITTSPRELLDLLERGVPNGDIDAQLRRAQAEIDRSLNTGRLTRSDPALQYAPFPDRHGEVCHGITVNAQSIWECRFADLEIGRMFVTSRLFNGNGRSLFNVDTVFRRTSETESSIAYYAAGTQSSIGISPSDTVIALNSVQVSNGRASSRAMCLIEQGDERRDFEVVDQAIELSVGQRFFFARGVPLQHAVVFERYDGGARPVDPVIHGSHIVSSGVSIDIGQIHPEWPAYVLPENWQRVVPFSALRAPWPFANSAMF